MVRYPIQYGCLSEGLRRTHRSVDLYKYWAAHMAPMSLALRQIGDHELSAVKYNIPVWFFFATWCRANDVDPYQGDRMRDRMPSWTR